MSDLDAADEILASIAKAIMIEPATDQSQMFNEGVDAMRANLVAGLEARGFRIVHAGALDALWSIIDSLRA